MPYYFFDIRNDGQQARDSVGSDLASDTEAEREAIETLQEMAKSLIIKDGNGGLQSTVRDAAGRVIFKATLALTLERMEE